eukprot:NODE_2319_length_1232_cov_23.039730_g2114_i0.p1 GENE.NODE_2319_length_1232_cov_23.039730_g2114_i0~~NODE_2319_length_1232_cov_23.039730_g2114_i0.p1  ORF type:complete len:304 (+),score=42.32 NODE_2319_length_1232_cov_23.039730_g2114_i0:112-912(+)
MSSPVRTCVAADGLQADTSPEAPIRLSSGSPLPSPGLATSSECPRLDPLSALPQVLVGTVGTSTNAWGVAAAVADASAASGNVCSSPEPPGTVLSVQATITEPASPTETQSTDKGQDDVASILCSEEDLAAEYRVRGESPFHGRKASLSSSREESPKPKSPFGPPSSPMNMHRMQMLTAAMSNSSPRRTSKASSAGSPAKFESRCGARQSSTPSPCEMLPSPGWPSSRAGGSPLPAESATRSRRGSATAATAAAAKDSREPTTVAD